METFKVEIEDANGRSPICIVTFPKGLTTKYKAEILRDLAKDILKVA